VARTGAVIVLGVLALGLGVSSATAPARRAPARRAPARRAPARRAPATFAAAGCPHSLGTITQSMSGRVSGCLRIAALAPGLHSVVLLQQPNLSAGSGSPRRLGLPGGGYARPRYLKPHYAKDPALSLSLSPASGGPGTEVTITVRMSSRLPRRALYPNVCWDGCGTGLVYGGVPIHRVSPTMFRAQIVVPAAQWIDGGPARVAPLASGDYTIGIQLRLNRSSQRCCCSVVPVSVINVSVNV
jgi:hypothetical protein